MRIVDSTWIPAVTLAFCFPEHTARMSSHERLSPEDLLTAKKLGFSDAQIGHCVGITEQVVSKMRKKLGE